MKKIIISSSIILASITCGILLYAIMNDWIIIRIPNNVSTYQSVTEPSIKRKTLALLFWQDEKWNNENIQIIWTNKIEQDTKNLINCWLNLLDEEGIMEKKVTVQSVALTQTKTEGYISFDQNPFPKESSTFEKWLWTEGLLKTLRENNISIQSFYFLVHHKIISDNNLDFTNAWPIEGFL